MVVSDAHLRQDVGNFPRDPLGDRMCGGESGFEFLGPVAGRGLFIRRQSVEVSVQSGQKFASLCVDVTGRLQFPVEFAE